MSIAIWHTYGYGISTDKITTSADKLRSLIDSVPDAKKKFLEYIAIDNESLGVTDDDETTYKNASLDALEEIYRVRGDFSDNDGLAGIIHLVISTDLSIPLIACKDYNSENSYVVMPSYYPWEVNSNPILQSINSEDDIKKIFEKYIAVLTDQTLDQLDWGEQNIEGWG